MNLSRTEILKAALNNQLFYRAIPVREYLLFDQEGLVSCRPEMILRLIKDGSLKPPNGGYFSEELELWYVPITEHGRNQLRRLICKS